MRHYRFDWVAVLIAVAYVAVVLAFGVTALITGDGETLLRIATHEMADGAPAEW
ncbi:hypothetical protein [Microtetraspora glauca]|uniref:Uncharacterized protein n=1 Tax=Microtetraspora glauca TaxID=1996 RepID=A0ABV3GG10_MICGL